MILPPGNTGSVIALQDCFELGVILLRKKLYTQAVKNLERARKSWNGLPDELAQVQPLANVVLDRSLLKC